MRERRVGCCAVRFTTLDNSGGCSSNTPAEGLVVLGGSDTAEMFTLPLFTWQDIPPMRKSRELCTAVVFPPRLTLEQ